MADKIGAARAAWLETAQGKERRDEFETLSGLPLVAAPCPLDVPGFDYVDELGFPGQFPYTRGIQPTMYRGRLWTMRQYAGFGSAEETNRRFRMLLQAGQTGLSVAFDLPTQMGLDSDDPRAEGEVGKVGVAIDTVEDMAVLLAGIPLDQVSTSMTINAPAAILLAMYIVVAERQGVSRDKLSGTIQNDILKEYAARGTYIFPPKPSLRLVTDTFKFCASQLPRWNTISISGYHIREAGSTAVQEVAFTLANGLEYVRQAMDAGLELDSFAPRLSFFFNAHLDFFEEIAKFRAARRLWAHLMQQLGAKNPRSLMLRFHTQTAGSSLTAQQPLVNTVRTTIEAMAAVLGGTQSLHTNSFDEALALPTEASATLALRTQQVIGHESGLADVIDPLAGSYHVERLTRLIEEGARAYLDQIAAMGGAAAALEAGFIQREIEESAFRDQRAIERGDRIVVGVNKYVQDEEPVPLAQPDPEVEARQVKRLAEVRASRDEHRVTAALSEVARVGREGGNLMQTFVDAVRVQASLGEIVKTLRPIFGQYRPGGKR